MMNMCLFSYKKKTLAQKSKQKYLHYVLVFYLPYKSYNKAHSS